MSQDPSILNAIAARKGSDTAASYCLSDPVVGDGLGRTGDLDNPAPAPGPIRMSGGPPKSAGAGPGSLSLPITTKRFPDPSVPEPDKIGCPNMAGRSFLNLDTGQIVPARCTRLRCSHCLRVNARRRAMAISLGAPERAILLTQVGNDWQTVRQRMKKLRHDLSLEVGPFQWVWHVEPNPKGTGHHVHAWQHSAYLPQKLLSDRADGVGMGGLARINKIRSLAAAGSYGLKGITYGLKGVEAEDQGLGYLVDNGWRLTHQSRGYFRDGRGGERVAVKDAERLALDPQAQQAISGRWVLIATPPEAVPV
jgi:hypothetical protein